MAFDLNSIPEWQRQWAQTQSPTMNVNAQPTVSFEQWMQNTGQYLPSGGSQEEYLRSGASGQPGQIWGGNQYASPEEAGQPYLRGYEGGLSNWMVNPETGKEGQLYSQYGTSGDLSSVLWRDKPDKNTWIDKALNIAPYAIGGVALGAGMGLFGGAAGGASGAGSALGTAGAFTTPVAAPSALATPLFGGGTAAAGGGLAAGASGLGGSAGTGLLAGAGGVTGLTSAGTAAAAPATSLATTGLGGGGMGLWDSAVNWITGDAGSKILGDVGSSLLQGYAGRQGAQANEADALRNQQLMMDLAKMSADESRFRPVNVTNTFGSTQWGIDPETGKVTSAQANLSPEMQAYIASAMGKGGEVLGGVSAGTPQEIAQAEFDRYKAFAAPKQMEQFEALQNRLQAQGLLGLGMGGGEGVNPFMRDFSKGVSEADYAAYKDAQILGQELTDKQLGRANTLFGTGTELDKIGAGMLGLGAELGGRNINATGANALLQAGQQGASSLLSAQQAGNKANTLFAGNAAAGTSPLLQAILQGMR